MTEKYSMAQDEFMDLLDKAEPLNKPLEILPPELHSFYDGYIVLPGFSKEESSLIKMGMELCYFEMRKYMLAALPHYEAGLRDTRIKQADGEALAELARFLEIANHGS